MRCTRITLVVAAGLALLAAACGGDDDTTATGDPGDARTVEIDMVDIAFEPESIEVGEGDTVRFVFTNEGEVAHDAFIGDADAQAEHEAEMREAEEMDDHGMGDDAEAEDDITVQPGESGELSYTFEEAGTVEIGCHQPGHYDGGMKVSVEVA